MKIKINEEEYNLSEECMSGLLENIKDLILQANLPRELKEPLLDLCGVQEEDIRKFIERLKENGLSYYRNLNTPVRIGAMQLARWMIPRIQASLESYEAKLLLVPPRRKDPIEHIIDIFHPIIQGIAIQEITKLINGTLTITTKDNTVTSVNFSQNING